MRFGFLILCLCLLAGCQEHEFSENTLVYKNAKQLKPFKLQDQYENEVSNADFDGQWTLIFLGYTSCPDICPMTLSKLQQVHTKVQSEQLQVWFVSVDPARDIAEKRKLYIDYFDATFKGISGEHKQLFPFVRDINLVYAMTDSKTENYTVDHSASVALVNPKGQLHAIFKPKFAPGSVPTIEVNNLIKDLDYLIERG